MIKEKWQKILVLLVIVIAGSGGLFFLTHKQKEEPETLWEEVDTSEERSEQTTESTTSESSTIMVDVKGAVQKPGVYELAKEARMKDAIMLAGGTTEDAEVRQLNLAQKLEDQQMIYVPTKEEAKEMTIEELVPESESSEEKSDLVNINTADLNELITLSGIGPAKAQAIIDYREENGAFKSIDDLQQVSGFGEKTVEKLRESITI